MLFYFTDIKIYIYLYTLLCVYMLLLLSCFGCCQYILSLSIIPSSFYAYHTIWLFLARQQLLIDTAGMRGRIFITLLGYGLVTCYFRALFIFSVTSTLPSNCQHP